MSIVMIPTSRTYIIRKETEAEALSQRELAIDTAERYKGKVLKSEKLREGAYLLVVYFSDETLIKDWETRTGVSMTVPMSQSFILSADNEHLAVSLCSKAKDMACKCGGNILMENKLAEGIYLMQIFFKDESLMGFWKASLGAK